MSRMPDLQNAFLLLYLVSCCNSFNILLVHELGTKSHLIQLFPIIEGLLEQGHTVNAAIFSPSKIKHENYTEIPLKNVFEKRNDKVSEMMMEKGGQGMFNFKLWQAGIEFWRESLEEISVGSWKSEG